MNIKLHNAGSAFLGSGLAGFLGLSLSFLELCVVNRQAELLSH